MIFGFGNTTLRAHTRKCVTLTERARAKKRGMNSALAQRFRRRSDPNAQVYVKVVFKAGVKNILGNKENSFVTLATKERVRELLSLDQIEDVLPYTPGH